MSKGELMKLKRVKKMTVDGKEIHYWVNRKGEETGKGRFKIAKMNKQGKQDLEYPNILNFHINNKIIATCPHDEFVNYIYEDKYNLYILKKIISSKDNDVVCKLNELLLGPEIRKGFKEVLNTYIMIINNPIENEYISFRDDYDITKFKSGIIQIDGYNFIAIKNNDIDINLLINYILKAAALLLQYLNNNFLKINGNIMNYHDYVSYYKDAKEYSNKLNQDEYLKWLQIYIIKQKIFSNISDDDIKNIF